eukprot:13694468-Ditylum_brightwellii.AAC.1
MDKPTITATAAATPPPRKRAKVSTALASPLERLTPQKRGGYVHGADKVEKTKAVIVNEVADFIETPAEQGCC